MVYHHHISDRGLLENNTLTQDEAYKQAISLDRAQKNSSAYNSGVTPSLAAAAYRLQEESLQDQNPDKLHPNSINSQVDHTLAVASSNNSTNRNMSNLRKNCGYCGGPAHIRQSCSAREAVCYHCGIVGHFSQVCRQKSRSTKKTTATVFKPSLFAITDNLTNSASECVIQGQNFSVLIDSCSSDSYISGGAAHKLNIVIENCNQEVDLASSDKTVKITGMCTVDIHLHGHKYESVHLEVMQKTLFGPSSRAGFPETTPECCH